jgi:DNA polymerase
MERDRIKIALAQTLQAYRRAGVNHFIPLAADQLPEAWLGRLSALDDSQEDIAHATESIVSHATDPVVQTQLPTGGRSTETVKGPLQPRSMPSGQSASPTIGNLVQAPAEAGSWPSENLPDASRKEKLGILEREIKACRRCTEICDFRMQTVFGSGPIRPMVCFMGEAPGADEDRQGQPFVGRAGQLLTKIIEAMKLKRNEVYILNALKCRPPNNRTPLPDEIANCKLFVQQQLQILQPRYIVCLGAVAVRSLLGNDTPVGQLRGKFFNYHGASVVVTYHPSYLLRNESAKKLVWQDMQMLMRELGISP